MLLGGDSDSIVLVPTHHCQFTPPHFYLGHPQRELTGIRPKMSGSDLIKCVGTCLEAPVMIYFIAWYTLRTVRKSTVLYTLPCCNYHMFLSSNIVVAWHEVHMSEGLHQFRRSRWLKDGLHGFRETRTARSTIALTIEVHEVKINFKVFCFPETYVISHIDLTSI